LGSYPAVELHLLRRSSELEERLHAVLDDFSPVSIVESGAAEAGQYGWRVFFSNPWQRDAAAAAVRSSLGSDIARIAVLDVADDGWARRSQASLTAVRVGRVIVAPPWDLPPAPAAEEVVILIEPSTGFGTGHHASTRLSLLLLQRTALEGRRIIDVGTGSGVLAIAARRLGAASALAVDYDLDAIDNARANVAANAIDHIDVRQADLAALDVDAADVVVGNLTSGLIERHAAVLRRLVRPAGVLIVSGFTRGEAGAVSRALGLSTTATVTEEDWTALACRTPTVT
jgi:ribosomal protein L11 methyltransferase